MNANLTNAERLKISAVVHQNYYMPDVFTTVEQIVVSRLAAIDQVINALDDEHYDAEKGGGKYCREGSCAMCKAIARLNAASTPAEQDDAQ